MPAIAFVFNAAAVQTWLVAEDVDFAGMTAHGSPSIVVSNDPSLTAAAIVSNQGQYDHLIAMMNSAGTSPQDYTPVSWHAQKGDKLFISADNSGMLVIYYNTPQLS